MTSDSRIVGITVYTANINVLSMILPNSGSLNTRWKLRSPTNVLCRPRMSVPDMDSTNVRISGYTTNTRNTMAAGARYSDDVTSRRVNRALAREPAPYDGGDWLGFWMCATA